MSEPAAVEIRGLSKTFQVSKRKEVRSVDLNTTAAFVTMVRGAFRKERNGGEGVLHVRALEDINLIAQRGEVLGIIGRNGAGKSTLLKILARVLDPSEGTVTISGRVVSLLELGIGFAPDLTVRENIRLYGQLAGMSAGKIRKAEAGILEMAELTDHYDVALNHCPGGSFVRLAFATMMGVESDIILADEVLAVGDAKFRAACEQRILDVAKTGETVFFVSHDMDAITRLCSRVVWIDQGRIRMIGDTRKVIDAYLAELIRGHPEQRKLGPIEQAAEAIDLRLTSTTGAPVGALQLNTEAFLEALFRLDRPGVHACVIFELFHQKRKVFEVYSPRANSSSGLRTFSAKVLLPADFLNEALYEARASIVIETGGVNKVLANTKFPSLVFQAMNTAPETSVWAGWNWSRRGSVSPRLKWTCQEL